MKETIKLILKLVFAGAIIYYLVKSDKLDFSLIGQSLNDGYNWLYCFLILCSIDGISAIRWRWLLKTSSDAELPIISMIRVTWIGLFFNSFLPGAVTGDFIKLVYARDLDPKLSKTFLVMSVLMDRVLGLMGLLLLLGIATSLNFSEIVNVSPAMEKIVYFNLLLFLGAIFFVITLFLPESIQNFIKNLTDKIPVIGHKVSQTLTQVWIMGKDKMVVIKSILLSVVLHFGALSAFYIISSPFYSKEIPLQYVFSFIPIGFMATAVPISPAGLGVGHAIFDKLYEFMGIAGGAGFFNLYFLCLVLANSLGLIPYLFGGKRHSLEETHQFEESAS